MQRSVYESNPNARHEYDGRYRSADEGTRPVGSSEHTRPAFGIIDVEMPAVTGAELLRAAAITKAQKMTTKAPS